MVAAKPALNIGYFAFSLLLLGTLDSLVVEPTHLSHIFTVFFDSRDTEIANIMHRARGDHPKFFLA